MKKQVLPEREWLTIRGRRILSDCFIDLFDAWRSDRLFIGRSITASQELYSMGYGIQLLTDSWAHGMNTTDEYWESLDEYHLENPQETHLPEALEDLVGQIEKKLHISIDYLLDRTAEQSVKAYEEREKERKKERERYDSTRSIADAIHVDRSKIPGKMSWLLLLQERKLKGHYEVSETQKRKEIHATELWCSLLIHSMNSEYITKGQMKMLVEDEIMDESAMSTLLQDKYHDKRDYEWYSEDFLGCDLNEETILRIEDVLEEAEPVFRKVLGIGEKF